MWIQDKDVVTQSHESGSFLLNMRTGVYFGLNDCGKKIWNYLAQPMNKESLIKNLVSEFEVSSEVAQKDIEHYLQSLEENQLICKHS